MYNITFYVFHSEQDSNFPFDRFQKKEVAKKTFKVYGVQKCPGKAGNSKISKNSKFLTLIGGLALPKKILLYFLKL